MASLPVAAALSADAEGASFWDGEQEACGAVRALAQGNLFLPFLTR